MRPQSRRYQRKRPQSAAPNQLRSVQHPVIPAKPTQREPRPRLLDLFAGAGGAARGYQMAGFHVTGVDIVPQPRYAGDAFIQADALTFPLEGYDAIHASPPCQGYSRMRHLPWLRDREYPMLIAPIRERLLDTGLPYVIENVEDARPHMLDPIRLCGLSFSVRMYRHRLFESNLFMLEPPHIKHEETIFKGRLLNARYSRASGGRAGILPDPAGHTAGVATKAAAVVMGVEWASRDEMTQAIPPAFTKFVGLSLLESLARVIP